MALNPTTYNTGNPVPSNSAKDLDDNARFIDAIATDQTGSAVIDRLGKSRDSLSKLESQYIVSTINGGVWAAGVEITALNQYMSFNGVPYKAKSTQALPYTTVNADATLDSGVEPFNLGLTDQQVEAKIKEVTPTLTNLVFNSVADMKLPSNSLGIVIQEGYIFHTKEYLSGTGNGGARYIAKTSITPDELGTHTLPNGLFAELYPEDNKCLFSQFGASTASTSNQDSAVAFIEHTIPNKEFDILVQTDGEIAATRTGARIFGSGGVQAALSVSNVITITGNYNIVEQSSFLADGSQVGRGSCFNFVGNHNTINRSSVGWLGFVSPTVEGQQYGANGINLSGDHNEAKSNRVNGANTGVRENGIGNNVYKNVLFNTTTGVQMTNRSRNSNIEFNYIDCNNAGQGLQACDGIWGNRNHRGTTISTNVVLNAGEHGMYLQGDTFSVNKKNNVSKSYGDGIKVGGKTADNYWYPGETVRELAPNGDYTSFDVTVDDNICEENQQGAGTGAEIYFQPNVMDSTISNNRVRFGGSYGIRTVFFTGGTVNDVMKGISVFGNKVNNCVNASIEVACSSDLYIFDNQCDGEIRTTSRDGAEPTLSSGISNNKCLSILISRQDDCQVQSNKASFISVVSNFASLFDNKFTTQNNGSFGSRVVNMRNNTFTFAGDVQIPIQGCNRVEGNRFIFTDATSNYPLNVDFNSTTPNEGLFSNNSVIAKLTPRPVRVGGLSSSIVGNTVINNGANDFAFGCYANGCSISGNTLNAGSIRMETGSGSCVISGNAAQISDSGTGNILGTNKP